MSIVLRISIFFSTLFYVGCVKFMPGTIASFVTSVFLYNINTGSINIVIISTIAYLLSMITNKIIISNIKDKDPSFIVIDEFVGQAIAIAISKEYIFTFLAFRLFDILKPYPINIIDNYNTKNKYILANTIMLDDLVAGVFAGSYIYCIKKIYYYL